MYQELQRDLTNRQYIDTSSAQLLDNDDHDMELYASASASSASVSASASCSASQRYEL
jgi:hypothetical protein